MCYGNHSGAEVNFRKGFESGDPTQVRHIYYNEEYLNKYTKENWMCKNYCPYKEKCDVIRAKEESEKINLGSGIAVGVTTIPSSSCRYHHFHY